jgi:glutamate synthase (NADPH) small chain
MAGKADQYRTPMPRTQARARLLTFDEVARGYSEWQVVAEANRCLDCATAPCAEGCPLQLDVRRFLGEVAQGDFDAAYDTLTDASPLPGVSSRVCRQETACESRCSRPGDPVAVGRIERFIADWGASRGRVGPRTLRDAAAADRQPVAVIGSGPAGLVAAADLARLGYPVTIFEAHQTPGGMLTYGIPEFRLPKAVVEREIAAVRQLGVEIRVNHCIGETYLIDDLFGELGFEAVFLAPGASYPQLPNIPGTHLGAVLSAHDYLAIARLTDASPRDSEMPAFLAHHVTVIGGGDSALDAARTAARLGAGHVRLVYRRTRAEMTARKEEITLAAEEGIEMSFLATPVQVIGDASDRVTAVRFQEVRLGAPDESGRGTPVPIEDAYFTVRTDLVVFATGGGIDPMLRADTPVRFSEAGYIESDPLTGATAREGLFAGGHAVNGGASATQAMGDGRRVAWAIHRFLCREDSRS